MTLKLLHTSDWHLGKRLYGLERLPEQERFLTEVLQIIKNENIDHLLIAGDVFDVPQPPHRALRLFYDFIAQFTQETKAELWLIGGNHDSGTLLDAPAGLIDQKRVHLFGALKADQLDHWVKLPFANTHLDLCLLPYFRNHELSQWKTTDQLSENFAADVLKTFLTTPPKAKSAGRIFMGHHLFGMFEAAGSEQALALSGLESIPLEWLKDFDYAALGHIHKPQTLSKQKPLVRYCGSPIAMRFSETTPKGLSLLEWQASGEFTHTVLPLKTHRPLYSLNVTQENWEETLTKIPLAELAPAVELMLKLKAPVPGLLENIRTKAEELKLELLNILPMFELDEKDEAKDNWTELLQLSPQELFNHFYLSKYPEETEVPSELAFDMKVLWEEARRASPEA